ncbi:MAG: sulfatase-like hydrolase/transferase [Acidimicrobiia bacterium]|nr:sulfatase-like hydrolase/transferase [Acidimicrobiia bacterium]
MREAGAQHWWWHLLAVLAVGALTISATILTIIGDAPVFFVAKGMTTTDIVLFGLIVVFAPVVLAVPVILARLASTVVAGVVVSLVLGGLVAVLVGHFLDGLDQTGEVVLVLSGLVGLLVASLYGLTEPGRSLVRFLSPAPLIVLGLFLFTSPTATLLSSQPVTDVAPPLSGTSEIPVVILVVDEFPLAALVNQSGDFLDLAFPGMGSLVDDGVWYRNAVTNTRSTMHAVPMLATGVFHEANVVPTAGGHPNSFLSALGRTHDVGTVEPMTRLCPARLCEPEEQSNIWAATFSDVGVVAAHIVLPNALAAELPPIDENWANFDGESRPWKSKTPDQASMDEDPRLAFENIGKALETQSRRPLFVFGHAVLPHIPWNFLPDGTRISGGEQAYVDGGQVLEAPWAKALGMQRLLLTAGYVDNQIGELLDGIREAGWYDEAMIVVVSDHGVSFESGHDRRALDDENVDSVAPIPLIVKYPKSMEEAPPPGTVDDIRAESVDLAPTVFDVIGRVSPYEVDGVSLLDTETRSQRTETLVYNWDEKHFYDVALEPSLARAVPFDNLFPDRDPWQLEPLGITESMRRTPERIVDDPDVEFEVRDPERFEDVDLDSEPVPLVVFAEVTGVEAHRPVGVLLNGELAVLTATYQREDIIATGAVLPLGSLQPGKNTIQLVALSESGPARG